MSKPPFNFEELRNSVYYHNIRIYIFGADVTPWLTSNLTIKRADRSGVNICSFSLSNANRSFEMTGDNLPEKGKKPKFRLSDPYSSYGKYSELAKFTIHKIKSDPKNNIQFKVNAFRFKKAYASASKAQETVTYRYPFTVGSLVFHKYDPIRVFVQNPFSRDGKQWTCEFTGYVDSKPYAQNYVDGSSVINITCQDIRALMQGMRTQVNPTAQIGNENTVKFSGTKVDSEKASAGFFNDLLAPGSQISHVLGGMTWIRSVKYLLFGHVAKVGDPGGKGNGVGKFTLGGETYFDAAKNNAQKAVLLEDWNNLISFGKTKNWLSEGDVNKMGSNTYHGGVYSPDNQLVWFLLPSKTNPMNNQIEYNMADGTVTARLEWVSRLELLRQLCVGIDYQMHVSGIGDIIFEFPMYDFSPEDYGAIYEKIYTFEKHLVNDNINDEGGTPITGLIINSNILQGEIASNHPSNVNTDAGVALPEQLTNTIFSNVLASRIGVHVETHYVAGVTNQNRLTRLGMIEFNKRLSNFDKFDISASYRPFIGVNRPIYHKIKERMGIVENVDYSWSFRNEVTLSMDLVYTRRKEADGSFKFITGGDSMPISYREIYDGKKQAYIPKMGVSSSAGNTGEPTPSPQANESAGI